MTTGIPAANSPVQSLKKQAKALLKALHAGDAAARHRVLAYFSNPSAVGLQDVQLVLAREQGFSSWARLKTHLAAAGTGQPSTEQLADRFLSLVTVSYFSRIPADPARFAQALTLVESNPGIVDHSIHSAAAAGDARRVERFLDAKPALL